MNKLPKELSDYVKTTNDKLLLNGYIRLFDENEYERYSFAVEKSDDGTNVIPFGITAFGDILAWSEDEFVMLYRLKDDSVDVLLSGFAFFFKNIEDEDYQKDFFELDLYNAAVEKLGALKKDESYTIEPLPMLGGSKDVEHLDKGKTFEYLNVIISFMSMR